jgi:uncharacterized SAM-binding protein YcdF (DUF218 family)
MRARLLRLARGAALGFASLLLAGELAHAIASRAGLPPATLRGDCAVLVLGYPSHADGSPSPIQRLRVAAGVASMQRHACERIVVSGGAVHTGPVEAETLAALARDAGVPADRIVVEDRARTTRENVSLSLPLLRDAAVLIVASDAIHAQRGRRYVCEQAPARCDRVFTAPGYAPFAHLGWTLGSALYETNARIRDALRQR